MEPHLEVSQRQVVFGEVATHAWADQNLVLANQGALLPIRFNIPHSPYFHCLPNQGMLKYPACSAGAAVRLAGWQQCYRAEMYSVV